ncbi:MAG: hypothetical protein HFI33_13625 [Lachnospiraceae bacterium]|nr:hypothetical protein [Lachnospiraceae bacterium]
MDVIDRAVESGKQISGNMRLDCQTWADFEKEMTRKKVMMFGAGVASGYYFDRYGEQGILEGVIDNDSRKQGFRIDEFVPEAFGLKGGEKIISCGSLLDSYNPDETVVLITSINDYEIIGTQLSQNGFTNYFVLLIMEANERNGCERERDIQRDMDSLKTEFVKYCCQHERVDRRKLFFRAYGDYADHGKYITEALLKTGEDLDLVWSVHDLAVEVPQGVRKIYEGNWKRFIYEMETAGIWILDLTVPEYIIKRPEQLYIQTKHWASVTLKKFYLDAAFETEPEKIKIWEREKGLIDHIITGSAFDTASCRRGFGFEGEVLQYGSPRSDGLFWEEKNREKVYEYFAIEKERRVLLYAPTYRFNKELGKSAHESRNIGLEFQRLKGALERRFGGEWYILVRLHPSVATAFEKVEKPDFVIDASRYGDSQELVSASHILISDFSSIMFEAAFVKKPVFLFATDLEDYLSNEYELLLPYRELPFPVAESNEELERNMEEFDMDSYKEKVELFLKEYGVHEDGHASERVARFIVENILCGENL